MNLLTKEFVRWLIHTNRLARLYQEKNHACFAEWMHWIFEYKKKTHNLCIWENPTKKIFISNKIIFSTGYDMISWEGQQRWVHLRHRTNEAINEELRHSVLFLQLFLLLGEVVCMEDSQPATSLLRIVQTVFYWIYAQRILWPFHSYNSFHEKEIIYYVSTIWPVISVH